MQRFGWTTLCWPHEDLAGRAIVAGPGAIPYRSLREIADPKGQGSAPARD
jgi:hypothetical protein